MGCQLAALTEGKLDGGFLGWRDVRDSRFDAITVLPCGLRIAMPKRASANMKVPERLADLASLPCVRFNRDTAPAYYDFLIRQCQLAGFSPSIVQSGGDTTTILGLVAAGLGCSIVPGTALHS